MAIPAAPKASAATRPRPSLNPPAATTGTSIASTTWGTRIEVGTEPVCPPPSPPCTITTSAPELNRLLGVAHGTAGRNAENPGILEALDEFRVRSPGVAGRLHAVTDDGIDDQLGARCLHQEVDAEGPVGELLDPRDQRVDLFRPHRGGGEEADRPRVAAGRDHLGCRDPSHRGLDDRMADAEDLTERCVECGRQFDGPSAVAPAERGGSRLLHPTPHLARITHSLPSRRSRRGRAPRE